MTSKLSVAIHPRHAHAEPWQRAFAEGLRRHGIYPEWIDAAALDSDLAVVWSVNDQVFANRRARGLPVLVMEQGYLGDRAAWCSLGYDGLNGRADFVNRGMPGDRWERYFAHLMRPWRGAAPPAAPIVLIMGQVAGDAALANVDFDSWAAAIADAAQRRWPGARVHLRPHPGTAAPRRPLAEDLAGAWLAVTWNSNAGVDAALAGVPTVAIDRGSMAWAVAAHGLAGAPIRPDRTRWAHELAHCQWSAAEIAAGRAWDHLRRKFDQGSPEP